ncbi:TPA: hypothetical protein I7682_17675 [Vibrio vulnificus]|nr:hypothetical protein [Vibrio vulnificus]
MNSQTSTQSLGIMPASQRQSGRQLQFLRPENYLSPADSHFIPPTAQQIHDLAIWAGVSGGGNGCGKIASIAKVEEWQMKRWMQRGRSLDTAPIIPGPIWQYLLIRLGLVEQRTIRRVEPPSIVKEQYFINDEPLTLRAQIWYETTGTVSVDFYDDSLKSQSRKDLKPTLSIELPHEISLSSGNTIAGLRRGDAFEPRAMSSIMGSLVVAYKKFRITQEDVEFYETFLKSVVWPALWKLHDFYGIRPKDFLPDQLDVFKCKPHHLPDHRSLLSLCGWAGYRKADLAHLCGESVSRLNYFASGKGYEKVKVAQKQYENEEINLKQLTGIRWANQPSRHMWELLLASFGLVPAIPVVGRSAPSPRKTRTFDLKTSHGVATEFVKLESEFGFTNPMMSEVKITVKISTQKGPGEDKSILLRIDNQPDSHPVIEGAATAPNSTPPSLWEQLKENMPEVAHSYIDKALWASLCKHVKFHLSSV